MSARRAEPRTLPSGASELLELFARAHAQAEVRLWAQHEDGWACLYPARLTGDGAQPGAAARSLQVRGQNGLALEIRGNGIAAAETELLAAALEQILGYDREAQSAAREISERYEEINLLYSISEVLGSMLALPEAATRILTEVTDVLAARRASLWVYRPDERLHLIAAFGEEGLEGPIPVNDPQSVTARVFRERQPVNLERAPRSGEPFLSVPIQYTPPDGGTRTVGVIALLGRRTGDRFSAGDAKLLAAIGSQVGAALETHRLVEEGMRQQRLVRELELAHDLQLKLLPEAGKFEGTAQVAARCLPAESVGGDFYHLFRLSQDRLGVMIGDVSSHGFSAALIMALTMSALAIYAKESMAPADVLRGVHRALIGELETTEMYLSLFYAVVDPAAQRLAYANAGHPHAFCIHPHGKVTRLGATNPPLGTVPLDRYDEATHDWRPGRDLLCLFTDGLSDAFAGREPATGERALLREIVRLREQPLADIIGHIFAAAERATLAVPPDDRTAVLVRA